MFFHYATRETIPICKISTFFATTDFPSLCVEDTSISLSCNPEFTDLL